MKNRMKMVISILILTPIIVSTIISCSKSPESKSWPQLRIGYLPIAAELPLFVAIEEGYFKEEGITYELSRFTSSNEMGNAATADHIDIMSGTASNVIFDIATVSGKKHLVFAINPYSNQPGHKTDHMIVRSDTGVTELSQLKGKRIASFPGSVNKIFVNLILEKYDVPRDSYEYIEMTPPNWQPALESGSIDAVSALEPAATQIIQDKVGESISQGFYAELMPDVPLSAHWIAADYYSRADKGQLGAFLRAYEKAIQFCRENEKQARRYLAKYANVRADIIDKVNLNPWQKLAEIDAGKFQAYVDLLAKHGALRKSVDVGEFLLPNQN